MNSHTAVMADWCESLAQRLRAGDSLVAAVSHSAAPPSDEIAQLRQQLQRGIALANACRRTLPQAATPAREVLGLLGVAAGGGLDPAHSLDRLAHALRMRATLAFEIHSQTAAVRFSALVLSALPSLAVVLTSLIAPGTATVLLTRPGLVSIGLAALLNGLGWMWIRRLIAAEHPT